VLYAFFLRNDVDRLPIGFEKKSLWASLNFGLQAHLGNMFHFLNWRLDLLVVNFFAGAANVGFYVVAATLAELLWYLPDAFGFVLFPKTASSDPETASQFTPKVARLSTFITAVAALGLFLVSRQAISVIYTEEFLPALYPLWILLPGVVALSYSKVIFSDLGGRGKPYYATYASLIAFLVTVVFDFLLIPRWGIIGAAVASSLSYTTNAVLAIAFYVRLTSNRLTDVLFIQKGDVEASYSAGRKMVIAISHSIRA
jgi:O-antigen/teichoic acid export membrane protein